MNASFGRALKIVTIILLSALAATTLVGLAAITAPKGFVNV
jgi:hypothetical protein